MNGLALLRILDSVYLLAVGTWFGALVWTLFGSRSEKQPGIALETISTLTLWGAVCGAIALPALVCGALAVVELRGPMIAAQASMLVAALLTTFWVGHRSRIAGMQSRSGTDALPGGSFKPADLTPLSFVAVLLISLLVLHAHRAPPRSQGIIERDPATQYREAHQAMRAKNERFWAQYNKQQQRTGEDGQASAPSQR